MFSARLLSLASAFAVAAAAAPVVAAAFEHKPRVSVSSCAVDFSDPSPITPFNPNPWMSTTVQMSFVNNSDVAATNIDLMVTADGEVEHFNTSGSFRPGSRVERTISIAPFANNVTCHVARVDFSNGTTWTPPPPPRKRASLR